MSQFDEEHGLDGPRCDKCGMVDCLSVRGCEKRQRENRHRKQVADLRAELARVKGQRDRLVEVLKKVEAGQVAFAKVERGMVNFRPHYVTVRTALGEELATLLKEASSE